MQTTLAQFNENATDDRFALQNPRMLRLSLDGSAVHVRAGSLVASQGDVALAAAEPPPGTPLTTIAGRGQAFVADEAQNVHLVQLEADAVACDTERVLALDTGVDWRLREVSGEPGAGVRALELTGSGWVALLSNGAPVLLDVAAGSTLVRAGAAIAWAEGVEVEPADGGLVRFHGRGWVLVQAAIAAP